MPPKPNELDRTTSTSRSRALCGTRSIGVSTDGLSRLMVGGTTRSRIARIEGPGGRKFLGLYTEAAQPRAALVIVHGVGVHPDHAVIGALRASLADAGYTVRRLR